jgi:hypothetical protein
MATTASRTRTTSLHGCACRMFEAGNRIDIEGGDVDFVDVRTTGCNASTTRLFAQGHDAKLVSLSARAPRGGAPRTQLGRSATPSPSRQRT